MTNTEYGGKPIVTESDLANTLILVTQAGEGDDKMRLNFCHIVVNADGIGETPKSRTLAYAVDEGENGQPTGRLLSVFSAYLELPDGSILPVKSLRPQ